MTISPFGGPVFRIARRKLVERAANDLFMAFREFARDCRLARAQHRRHVREAGSEPRSRLIGQQRCRCFGPGRERAPPGRPFRRQEAQEAEAVRRQARKLESRQRRIRSRRRRHREALRPNRAHKAETGVGNERHSRVARQRHGFSRPDGGNEFRPHPLRIVVVIGGEARLQPVNPKEAAGYARVLAGNEIGGGQNVEGAKRDVARIADRRRHQIQARRQTPLQVVRCFTRRAGRVSFAPG